MHCSRASALGQADGRALVCPTHTGIHASSPPAKPVHHTTSPMPALAALLHVAQRAFAETPEMMGTAHSAAIIVQALTYLGRTECRPAGKQCQNCARKPRAPKAQGRKPKGDCNRPAQRAATPPLHGEPDITAQELAQRHAAAQTRVPVATLSADGQAAGWRRQPHPTSDNHSLPQAGARALRPGSGTACGRSRRAPGTRAQSGSLCAS